MLLVSRKYHVQMSLQFTRISGHDIHIVALNLFMVFVKVTIGRKIKIMIIYGDEMEIIHQIVGDE